MRGLIILGAIYDFYSRPCGRGDLARPDNTLRGLRFLLTPLREGRLLRVVSGAWAAVFLLTPLREGRRSERRRAGIEAGISTHAPAGGATGTRENGFSLFGISTHAPAGGATIPELIEKYGLTQFLLTPLREGRRAALKSRIGDVHFYSRPCGRGDPTRRKR